MSDLEMIWRVVLNHHHLNKLKNSWLKTQTTQKMLEELKNEIKELEEALHTNNIENIKEETADILRDVLHLLITLENEKNIKENEVLQHFVEKDIIRKGWIYKEEIPTVEEQVKIWQEKKRLYKT